MIKVKYPSDLEKIKNDYLALFDRTSFSNELQKIKSLKDIEIDKLLVGDFSNLVDYYFKYKNLMSRGKITSPDIKRLKDIFNYTDYQPNIAKFLMKPDNGFILTTCHYCDMAYINSYSLESPFSKHLDFVNRATKEEWREHFTVEQLSDANIDEIISNREYASLDDFNNKYSGRGMLFAKRIDLYKGLSQQNIANHFDIDHLIPKSECPILSLSLFNFVPSCQVCNEKLKKAKELATTKEDWLKISPTSSSYSFDKDVTIKLVPEGTCSTFFELKQNIEKYHLFFDTNNDIAYNRYISVFRLNDRYNYHKKLALHILDLKERYSPEKRKEISKILSSKYDPNGYQYSEKQIEADIFEEDFNADKCFSKLRRDMIRKN